jgi:hypothetical protein
MHLRFMPEMRISSLSFGRLQLADRAAVPIRKLRAGDAMRAYHGSAWLISMAEVEFRAIQLSRRTHLRLRLRADR